MRIETPPKRRSRVIQFALVGSLVFHALLAVAFQSLDDQSAVKSYVVNMVVNEPEPTPPPPEPEPATPEPAKPEKLPPPNQTKPVPPSAEPPKQVFGATEDSFVEDGDGPVFREGNTLMKEPEKELTDPNNVRPYAPQAPEPIPETVNASQLGKKLKFKKYVEPAYPALANRAGKEGLVKLRFMVTKSGAVAPSSVKVTWVKPQGVGFEEAAMNAVKSWVFETPLYKGKPVNVWMVQTIRFQLKE